MARYMPCSFFVREATTRRSTSASRVMARSCPSSQNRRVIVRLRALRTLSVIRSGSLVVPMASTMVSRIVCISLMGMPSIRRFLSTFSKRA